jgi:hypothetical protein
MQQAKASPSTIALAAGVLLACAAGTARAQQAPGPNDLPAGHPPVGSASPHDQGQADGAMAGVFRAPEDVEEEDKASPAGTIAVELRDPDDRPLPREIVTLGILINSIAKGDTRKHIQMTTDETGRAVFSGLEMVSNIAYRVSCGYQGGSFAASPFQLPQGKAIHVVLHVYPVTRDIDSALIVAEATIATELKDDRLQIEEMLKFYNLGRVAWQPDDVQMSLPTGATAFNAQASMSDQGVDEASGTLKLRGTFGPGQHSLAFRWQLPWSGDKDVDFEMGMPPHTAIARVLMPAWSAIKLTVAGFPPAEVRHNNQGQSFLVTERQLLPDQGVAEVTARGQRRRLSSIEIGIHDLPTPGPGRLIATVLASFGLAFGLWRSLTRWMTTHPAGVGTQDPGRVGAALDGDILRKSVLQELALLERAHTEGAVGPKTYERARRELIDALALTLSAAQKKTQTPSAAATLS